MMYRLNTKNPMAVGVGFSQAGGKNSSVRVGIAGSSDDRAERPASRRINDSWTAECPLSTHSCR